VQLGQILFAAGATRVMVNGWKFHQFTKQDDLAREVPRIVQDRHDITLGTGHPQGGNAMSTSPQHGVVDRDFRVHGTKNLYVCDASVIPSSLTVNPQLTIMSLAHYASPRIAR
jgi:choline dehydrogenase-like flavoprotein